MNGKLQIPCHYLDGMSFGMYSNSEIVKLSVKEVVSSQSFDQLGHPTVGGLYDPALGTADMTETCKTCGLGEQMCPGHMGHIKLVLVCYNPAFFKLLHQLLRGTCFECHRISAKMKSLHCMKMQLKALEYGLIHLFGKMKDIMGDKDENQVLQGTGNEANNEEEQIGENGKAKKRPKMTEEERKEAERLKEERMMERMTETLEEALKDVDRDAARHEAQVKNVVQMRHKLVKDFISGRHFQKTKCAHCKAVIRPLKSEYSQRMFFASLSKQTIQKMKRKLEVTKKKKKTQKDGEDDEGDFDEIGDIVEIHEAEKKRADEKAKIDAYSNQEILTPPQAKAHLAELWKHDGELLSQFLGALKVNVQGFESNTDIFFVETLPIPPTKYRPIIAMNDMRLEGPQSKNFSKVLECNQDLRNLMAVLPKENEEGNLVEDEQTQDATGTEDRNTLIEKIQFAWTKLQAAVNTVFDSDLDKLAKDNQNGIKQLLEKKEGLFRKHMMGKRVNFAARSVISPDPYINTNEIGIPEVFAKKLYYPQPVTHWNFSQLKQAVLNGPNVHPGASMVIREDGSTVRLMADNKTQREAIAKQLLTPSAHGDHSYGTKKVCRHLQNGDVLLLNRQPTLHKQSIQAHRARVLPGEKTIRLHYANCKAYNADFDGDEMNAHFPQDEVSRAEAYGIAGTDFQYLVPKDGCPLAGLIQDHMVSGVQLTIRGRFFDKQDYQQLVFGALTNKAGPVLQLPPCMLKPRRLWSGKQVLSTVLLNVIPEGKAPLNLIGKSKISEKSFKNRNQVPRSYIEFDQSWPTEMGESRVVIQDGELLVGVLDKGHYGATTYGLVHSCYELYGGEVAGKLLTSLAKLFTCFLQLRGFTLGVEDILCEAQADQKRKTIMKQGAGKGVGAAASALDLDPSVDSSTLWNKLQEAHFRADGSGLKDLDLAMKGCTDEIQNEIAKHTMPVGLQKKFPHNNLQLMVQAGAKGTTVNCMQISCLLGQIELEGRRPPLMLSGQSLPSFPAYETSPRAGGFVDGRFLTGIRPQEYFFHCMAGREGLVDTAVKTSRSGYLQRCIIKHLEGLAVAYDQTVRDSDGSVVQFQYGEDGLEVPKTKFLTTKQIPFLINNQDVLSSSPPSSVNTTDSRKLWKVYKKWKKKNGDRDRLDRKQPFTTYCRKKFHKFMETHDNVKHSTDRGKTDAQEAILKEWLSDDARRAKYEKYRHRPPTPVVAQLNPARYLGAVTEQFEELIDSYLGTNPDQLVCADGERGKVSGRTYISPGKLKSLLHTNYLKALVPPGEAVGLVAAQSIGEPSTQMTLNTFHFAGRGEMNVTLGIPRLREILMVASAKIQTPAMDIPLFKTRNSNKDKQKGTDLKQKLNKVLLSQVLEDVHVTESLSVKNHKEKGRIYKIRFQFLPYEIYKDEFCVTPNEILTFMEESFFKKMTRDIDDKKKAMTKTTLLSTSRVKNKQKEDTGNEDEVAAKDKDNEMSDDEQHDADAMAQKVRARKDEENDYEGEEEEQRQVEEEESDAEADDKFYVNGGEENTETNSPAAADEERDGESDEGAPQKAQNRENERRKHPTFYQRTPQTRTTNVRATVPGCQDYHFDVENELWCEITLKIDLAAKKLDMTSCIEETAKKSVLHQVRHINRCFLSQSKAPGEEGVWRIKTEGVNIQEIYNHADILDVRKLYTNDIHAMAKNYGIEAACRVLIKEIRDVFANYGIQVDYRHLTLIADYMTFEGEYKAFNRLGLESNASPLQKMTFETTMHFLRTATITGARDDLRSPSSRIVTGQLVRGGTGAFEVMQNLNI